MSQSRGARHWPWIVAFAVAYALATTLVDNDHYLLIMTNVLVWMVVGLAWNLLSGYSGLVSFGHAAFFGLGAYCVVLARIDWGLTPWLGIPLAGLLGAVAGLVVGVPTFRLRGHYFALAMLAYPLALLAVFEWLGYEEAAVPRELERPVAMMQFDDRRQVYVLIALAIAVLVMAVTRRLERARYGMSLLAIRQEETAAEAAGIDTTAWKLAAIALSGAIAAAIGGFHAVVQPIVTPSSVFGVLVSAQALTVAMFGGVGTVWGPVIGAVTLVPLSAWLDAELADRLPGIQGIFYGIAIVVVILLAREGLFWRVRDLLERRRQSAAGDTPTPQPADRVAPGNDRGVTSRSTVVSRPPVATDTAPGTGPAPGPENETILELDALSKTFGGLRAVDGVTLRVTRGEILGVIGPNGAGKTTLFNVLNGFTKPDSGSVHFNGENVTALSPNRICRRGIGRTFQVLRPFRRMSIADNVVVGAFVHTDSHAAARELAAEALEEVGLDPAAGMPAGSATTEQLRLMELARALASRPSLLLLDEVFAGLNAGEIANLANVIRRLAGRGITIVISEHAMQAMARLVDRFVVLDHGAVLAEGAPVEVTTNPAVIEAYLGRKWLQDSRELR